MYAAHVRTAASQNGTEYPEDCEKLHKTMFTSADLDFSQRIGSYLQVGSPRETHNASKYELLNMTGPVEI